MSRLSEAAKPNKQTYQCLSMSKFWIISSINNNSRDLITIFRLHLMADSFVLKTKNITDLIITVRKISWIKKILIWKEQYDFGHQLHHSTTKINVHILISTGRFQINLHIHDSPLPTIDLCQTWHYLMRYCLKHIPPIYAFRDVQCIFLFYQHFKAKHQSFFYNTPATQKSCCGLFKGISFGACHVIFGRWHYTCISQS